MRLFYSLQLAHKVRIYTTESEEWEDEEQNKKKNKNK